MRKVQPISKSFGCSTRLNNSAADVESDPAEDPILLFEYDSKLLPGIITDAAFASVFYGNFLSYAIASGRTRIQTRRTLAFGLI